MSSDFHFLVPESFHKKIGLESPMLHTKFRENRLAGSGEEDF